MSRIKSKDTLPEKRVRSILHKMGLRYSLKRKDLPGRPDITLVKHKTAVFVHGCFWHRHKKCCDATTPKSNTKFWQDKFSYNVRRDKKNKRLLKKSSWNVIVIWECELRNINQLLIKLQKELKIPL